eukprot:scaffold1684_cov214-Amphora_coffeaeformis.AAC.9
MQCDAMQCNAMQCKNEGETRYQESRTVEDTTGTTAQAFSREWMKKVDCECLFAPLRVKKMGNDKRHTRHHPMGHPKK